jgi:hypothetical protein
METRAQFYPISVLSPLEGKSIAETLTTALRTLRKAGIVVDGGAQVLFEGREMATILLLSEQSRLKALGLLAVAGIEAQTGPAGFVAD